MILHFEEPLWKGGICWEEGWIRVVRATCERQTNAILGHEWFYSPQCYYEGFQQQVNFSHMEQVFERDRDLLERV